jgi:hypothetical protein
MKRLLKLTALLSALWLCDYLLRAIGEAANHGGWE